MDGPLSDERIGFYLRHRDEIREWAAIERDVVVATRETLAGIQAVLEEWIAPSDPTAEVVRYDGGKYERILVRRSAWPAGVGVVLEWTMTVDPFGGSLPKYGVFVLNSDARVQAGRDRMVTLCAGSSAIRAAHYSVPGDSVWPAVKWVAKSKDWWQDPGRWTQTIVDDMTALWPSASGVIEEALVDPR